jgi:hypothetical protein
VQRPFGKAGDITCATCAVQDFRSAHCRTAPISLDAISCFDWPELKAGFGVILYAWGGNEATRVHHPFRRRRSVAALCPRAAVGEACDWLYQQPFARGIRDRCCWIPAGFGANIRTSP